MVIERRREQFMDLHRLKLRSRFVALTILLTVMTDIVPAFGVESGLLEMLQPSVKAALSEFDQIGAERKQALGEAASFIDARIHAGKVADLTFVCTHNSRRSHFAQLWAQTAACYYGLTNVNTYSGGTEVAACNIRTVRALRRAGFSIAKSSGGSNPLYLAQFSDTQPAVKLYSKVFTAPENPQNDFAAIFCCDHAAESCPVVKNAALRLPVLYVDPKASDGSPAEQATYDERCRQIAREMFYMMSQVK
jgi:protein-tyrosine-phosphatase